MTTLEIVLLSVLAFVLAAAVVAWLFRKDTEIENRRRGAAKLAAVLANLGLKRTPEFLVDYSVGDYSGMAVKINELARLFLDGEEAVVAEFGKVFDSVLAAKLKSESGRAFIAAKLADATKADDASVIKQAPAPAVVPVA